MGDQCRPSFISLLFLHPNRIQGSDTQGTLPSKFTQIKLFQSTIFPYLHRCHHYHHPTYHVPIPITLFSVNLTNFSHLHWTLPLLSVLPQSEFWPKKWIRNSWGYSWKQETSHISHSEQLRSPLLWAVTELPRAGAGTWKQAGERLQWEADGWHHSPPTASSSSSLPPSQQAGSHLIWIERRHGQLGSRKTSRQGQESQRNEPWLPQHVTYLTLRVSYIFGSL